VHEAPSAELPDIVAEYLERFASQNGRLTVSSRLNAMFRHTGTTHPEQITTRSLLAWITSGGSNNTVRARLSTGRAFLRWCHKTGRITGQVWETLPDITKQYPSTYGKVQDAHPARFLTYEQAFGDLIGACQTGTPTGLRDEIAVRLGLSGMRVHEIACLTVGDTAQLPVITWTGKGHRARTLTAGAALVAAITEWLALRTAQAGRPTGTAPLLLPLLTGREAGGSYKSRAEVNWHATDTIDKSGIWRIVTTRARIAGLGHVAPHDLRRSAAAILHNSTTDDGAHRFDLLDIQRVLGHSDPATTMRSYLEPMDSKTNNRAAGVLD